MSDLNVTIINDREYNYIGLQHGKDVCKYEGQANRFKIINKGLIPDITVKDAIKFVVPDDYLVSKLFYILHEDGKLNTCLNWVPTLEQIDNETLMFKYTYYCNLNENHKFEEEHSVKIKFGKEQIRMNYLEFKSYFDSLFYNNETGEYVQQCVYCK